MHFQNLQKGLEEVDLAGESDGDKEVLALETEIGLEGYLPLALQQKSSAIKAAVIWVKGKFSLFMRAKMQCNKLEDKEISRMV